jgi:dihydrodipicolinate synthase/N-acetylneuraminate lyase
LSVSPGPEGKLPCPLRGIIPPMVTPLRSRDDLDLGGLEKLIEHMLSGGVHGIFILGTSGEAPSLSYRLRRELIERTCRQVAGRVPVLVGITDTAFIESLKLARKAADSGAAGVVSSAPYYFPAGQAELTDFFERLTPELPLPLFLYNMPEMTKMTFEIPSVRRLMQLERVVGIKDSSGDWDYLRQLLELAPQRTGWTVMVGPEHLLARTLAHGGYGGINGGANFHPRLFVNLYQAAVTGDAARTAALQAELLKLGKIYAIGQHGAAVIKGMKCALSLLGICDDFMAEPFSRLPPSDREKVGEVLQELKLIS